jgi:hypothetical protein
MEKKLTAPPGGSVLRVKKGFNPNSSGISSDIIAFFTTAAVVSALFATAAGIVIARFSEKPEKLPDAEKK